MAGARATTAALLILLSLPRPARPQTSLADGFLATRTTVSLQAALSLDVQDVYAVSSQNDPLTAASIYERGRNAVADAPADGSGEAARLTLKDLALGPASVDAGLGWRDDATHLTHLYGLRAGGDDAADDAPKRTYADAYVRRAIREGGDAAAIAESLVSLVMWAAVAHALDEGVERCRSSEFLGTEPEAAEASGVRSADEAMAYWIGADPTKAFSMFALAQSAAKELKIVRSKTAPANEAMKDLYGEINAALTMSNGCQPYSRTTETVYHLTNRMVNVMKIPLLQKLILALVADDRPRIELYALSVVPQISACSPTAHRYLQDKLYETQDYNRDTDLVPVMEALNKAYDCLGLLCKDISAPRIENYKCYDIHDYNIMPLAGYKPTVPVHQHARIDLDVLQMKVLVAMGGYQAADDLYTYGKHSLKPSSKGPKYRSIQSFATSKRRFSVEPFFDQFTVYFDDLNYADVMIKGALGGVGRYGAMSADQRAQFAIKAAQYLVMHMAFLTELHVAAEDCFSKDPSRERHALESLDRAAAYFIGSLEGTEAGGSRGRDGALLYNLSNRRCADFGTCVPNKPGVSMMAGEYLDLFYSSKGQLQAKNCPLYLTNVRRIEHVVSIPFIQSVVRYAQKSHKLRRSSPSKYLAEGELFSLALLPIIDGYDSYSADVIETNMLMAPETHPVADGPQAVADALYNVLDEFGIPCAFVGVCADGGVDVCDKRAGPEVAFVRGGASSASPSYEAGMRMAVLSVFLACGIWAFVG